MKLYKFKIFELYFGGTNERFVEVKARTLVSARKKVRIFISDHEVIQNESNHI